MVIHCFFVIWQVSNNIILENDCSVYIEEVHNMVSKSGGPQKLRTTIILENDCFVYIEEVHNRVSKSGGPQKFRTHGI
jgi:hypothetical protein